MLSASKSLVSDDEAAATQKTVITINSKVQRGGHAHGVVLGSAGEVVVDVHPIHIPVANDQNNCGRLFLPTYSLCLPLVISMHNVLSIAKRAPGMVHPSCCTSCTPASLLAGNRSLRWSGRRAPRQPCLHRSER